MLKLVSQYDQRESVIRLRGQWVSIDPREWRNGFDCDIHVGLGTGDRNQQIQHLMALLQQQQMGLQFGTATPENVYQAQQELTKALGYKSADKFFTDPAKAPPKPPQRNPEEIKAQAAMQLEQVRQQGAMQVKQAELQADIQRFQAQSQTEMQRIQMEAQAQQASAQSALQVQAANDERDSVREQARVQLDAELKRMEAEHKAAMDRERLEFERWKAELESQTQIYIAQLRTPA
jgi:hypothetical protein